MDNEFNKISMILEWGYEARKPESQIVGFTKDFLFLSILDTVGCSSFTKIFIWPKVRSNKEFCIGGTFLKNGDSNHTQFVIDETSKHTYIELLTYIRKHDHIDICMHKDVESSDKNTGFQHLNFVPNPCPEIDLGEVNPKVSFLGRQFDLPILITGMTGGIDQAQLINDRLAAAAQYYNIPMGVGSQRIALEYPKYQKIFLLKEKYPSIFLIGNLGFSEIMKSSDPISLCQRAIEMIAADALAIHTNVIQECIQSEGQKNFKGFLHKLERITSSLDVPIIIKEVGSGMSESSILKFKNAGAKAIDVGGRGGTAWGYIESLRVHEHSYKAAIGKTFRNWGIPTAYSLVAAQNIEIPVIATGGIRNGIMVAKAVGLGAKLAGVGLPLFRAAVHSEKKVFEVLHQLKEELIITMIATSSRCLSDLGSHICFGDPHKNSLDEYLKRKNKI